MPGRLTPQRERRPRTSLPRPLRTFDRPAEPQIPGTPLEDRFPSTYNKRDAFFLGEDPVIDTPSSDLSRLKIDWKATSSYPAPRRRLQKAKWIALAILLIVLIAVVYRYFSAAAETVEITTVVSVNPSQATTVLNASGYVVAQRRAAVASKGTGRLLELRVKEGDKVRKDEIIARLESEDMRAALARARANLNVAQAAHEQAKAELNEATLAYDRQKKLLEFALNSQADFEASEGRYRRAQAAVASGEAAVSAAEADIRAAEVAVENTNIRSPFDGTVLTKNAEIGEVVAPFGSATSAKAAVVTLADMSSLEVEADVSESNLEKVRIGQPCEISLDAYPETKYRGVVDTIVPTADRAKATVLTKIRFLERDDRVLPEMSAKVAFLTEPGKQKDARAAVAVQPGAVVVRGERKLAFLVRDGHVSEVSLELGNPVGSLLEIKHGLAPGDRVVVNPPEGLREGSRVKEASR